MDELKYWTVEFSDTEDEIWLPVMQENGEYRFYDEIRAIRFYEQKKTTHECALRLMERTEYRLIYRPDIRK